MAGASLRAESVRLNPADFRELIADRIESLMALLDLIDGDADFENYDPDMEDSDEDRCQAGDDGCGVFVREGEVWWGSHRE